MRPYAMGGLALLLAFGLSPGRAAAAVPQQSQPQQVAPATPPPPEQKPEAAAPAQEATLHCFDCHDQAKVFGTNPHAHGKVKNGEMPNSVCESCHGSGTAHMEGGGDKTLIYKPVGVEGANKVCLTCHDTNTQRWARHTGMHANSAAVNCLTCHSIHSSDPRTPTLLAKPQLALCATCHSTQVASFRNKPYAHRIGRGGIECSSCHEPHGRPLAGESLQKTPAGELPCFGCHTDKRGPFVFQHGSVAIGECMTCHEPHGSSNPKQLKRANVWQLCIECHSPVTSNTLGSQPPSFHNLTSSRYQNCTTCHTAIHGSNRDPQLFK